MRRRIQGYNGSAIWPTYTDKFPKGTTTVILFSLDFILDLMPTYIGGVAGKNKEKVKSLQIHNNEIIIIR